MFVLWVGVRLLERERETEAALSAAQTVPRVLEEHPCSALSQTYISPLGVAGGQPCSSGRHCSCQHWDTVAVGHPQHPNSGHPISSWGL